MARTELVVHSLDERNVFPKDGIPADDMMAAVDTETKDAEFEMSERDDKYLILVLNSDESNPQDVTVKSGNGLQGTADITVSLAANSYTFISLESGRFKNVSGEDKGKVVITGESADIKVAVFKLP